MNLVPDTVRALGMHETLTLDTAKQWQITRVPGGLIYSQWYGGPRASAFVPYGGFHVPDICKGEAGL